MHLPEEFYDLETDMREIVSGSWNRRAGLQVVSAVLVVLFLPVQSALSSSWLILPSRKAAAPRQGDHDS